MAERLRILISNDDGYDAPGILALSGALADSAEVQTVAPLENHSGASSKITLAESISIFSTDPSVHVVHGTPADCVQLAMQSKNLLPWRPDLTVSGINSGSNLGDDTIYSGTVAAALESILAGVPAIAFSLACIPEDNFPPTHFADAAQLAAEMVAKLAPELLGRPGTLLSVNIPDLPRSAIKGTLVRKLGHRHPHRPVIEDRAEGQTLRKFFFGTNDYGSDDAGDDYSAIHDHYVTVTPLQFDLTDADMLERTEKWLA